MHTSREAGAREMDLRGLALRRRSAWVSLVLRFTYLLVLRLACLSCSLLALLSICVLVVSCVALKSLEIVCRVPAESESVHYRCLSDLTHTLYSKSQCPHSPHAPFVPSSKPPPSAPRFHRAQYPPALGSRTTSRRSLRRTDGLQSSPVQHEVSEDQLLLGWRQMAMTFASMISRRTKVGSMRLSVCASKLEA